jgi:hypothetical protein
MASTASNSFSVRVVPQPTDALEIVLAGLGSGWSGNVLQNTYVGAVIERRKTASDFSTYYAPAGKPAVNVSSENPWAYSSPVYIPGMKKFIFTGGGHDDWLGSEVGVLSCATLTWVRTDESAKVAQEADETHPLVSNDSSGWRAWRNPSGRAAPISSHMYGGMVYLPGIQKVHVQGAASYRSGIGNVGGYTFIDAVTGQWDDNGVHVATGLGTDCLSVRIPTVYIVNSSDVPTGETLTDCVLRVADGGSPNSRLVDPVNKTIQTTLSFFSATFNRTCHGCIVPDPLNTGRLAYVADWDATRFCIMPRADFKRNNGTAHNAFTSATYLNTKPAALGTGSNARWIYMGDHISGCTKIAVYKVGVGVYAFDLASRTWSDLLISDPVTEPHGDGPWKRFEYLSDYDCFAVFGPKGADMYVWKRPSVFS